jgi:hypothetical protein
MKSQHNYRWGRSADRALGMHRPVEQDTVLHQEKKKRNWMTRIAKDSSLWVAVGNEDNSCGYGARKRWIRECLVKVGKVDHKTQKMLWAKISPMSSGGLRTSPADLVFLREESIH